MMDKRSQQGDQMYRQYVFEILLIYTKNDAHFSEIIINCKTNEYAKIVMDSVVPDLSYDHNGRRDARKEFSVIESSLIA